jgi:transcriptional regulator with XRE-family HTH domain
MNWNNEINELNNDLEFKMENVVLDFIELISVYMRKNNINQKQLAGILNISNAAISKLLNGKENFSIKRMVEITDKLGFNIAIVKNDETKVNISIDKNNAQLMLNSVINKSEIEDVKDFLSYKTDKIINLHFAGFKTNIDQKNIENSKNNEMFLFDNNILAG